MITMHARPRQTDEHHGNSATIRAVVTNASRAKHVIDELAIKGRQLMEMKLSQYVSALVIFADLKADEFTTAGNSSFVSELEKNYGCVVEVRTKG